jgi:two-component system nitrogen regulation sensor histidine kinase GlnL
MADGVKRPARPARRTKAAREATLRDLAAYYEDLLSSLQDGVIVLDGEARVVSVNPAAEELTGLSRAQLAGRPVAEAFPSPAPLASLAAKTLALGRNHADFDAVLVRADGVRVAVSVAASLLSDPSGESRGVVLVLRDLSRVHELEEQVRRSDRLAALGVLAAGVAHEVRNPLVGIRAAAQLLEREAEFPASFREFTGMIIRQVDRLNRIVDGLLTFAGKRPLLRAACNVNQILEEALRLEEPSRADGRIRMVRQYDPELPAVDGDADRLLQVFLNLVRNGAEAMAGTRSAPGSSGRPRSAEAGRRR